MAGFLTLTFDFDLWSSHTAYRRASFITCQISLKSNKLFVDGRTDGHLRRALLGRLWQKVDLKTFGDNQSRYLQGRFHSSHKLTVSKHWKKFEAASLKQGQSLTGIIHQLTPVRDVSSFMPTLHCQYSNSSKLSARTNCFRVSHASCVYVKPENFKRNSSSGKERVDDKYFRLPLLTARLFRIAALLAAWLRQCHQTRASSHPGQHISTSHLYAELDQTWSM